jgi:hypothetical protein
MKKKRSIVSSYTIEEYSDLFEIIRDFKKNPCCSLCRYFYLSIKVEMTFPRYIVSKCIHVITSLIPNIPIRYCMAFP